MICPPCSEAADMDQRLDVPIVHDPASCRDRLLDGHGCTCQHGQRRGSTVGEQPPGTWTPEGNDQ